MFGVAPVPSDVLFGVVYLVMLGAVPVPSDVLSGVVSAPGDVFLVLWTMPGGVGVVTDPSDVLFGGMTNTW